MRAAAAAAPRASLGPMAHKIAPKFGRRTIITNLLRISKLNPKAPAATVATLSRLGLHEVSAPASVVLGDDASTLRPDGIISVGVRVGATAGQR